MTRYPFARFMGFALTVVLVSVLSMSLVAGLATAECIAYEEHLRWIRDFDLEIQSYVMTESHDKLVLAFVSGMGGSALVVHEGET